ncbi:hypothetical protein ACE6H2_026380 [Prunus campanulata]
MAAELIPRTPGIKEMRSETRSDFCYSTDLGHGHGASMSLSPQGIRREIVELPTRAKPCQIWWSQSRQTARQDPQTDVVDGVILGRRCHQSGNRAAEGVGLEVEAGMDP